jgi:signal transduction histidine kinase
MQHDPKAMMILEPGESTQFLDGGGELGALSRSFNWSATSIGPAAKWPQSLKTIVGVVLHANFPMFLWWGEELIQFYNDAYRPCLGDNGKHPVALGQRGRDCWAEVWDVIGPLIQRVRETGDSFFTENQRIPIFRNGHVEEAYWTFCYSPVIGEHGSVDGILAICTETTTKVIEQVHFDNKISELSQFAYVVSHDLQEPARKISNFADLLGRSVGESIDRRSKEYIARIDQSATRMISLINEILQYSQSSGAIAEISYVDLGAVVNAALVDFELLIAEKGCTVSVDALPTIRANPVQMRQLFGNLISNALKFSRQGVNACITISSRAPLPAEIITNYHLSPDHLYIEVIVSDKGIGFNQNKAGKIFEVFERLHTNAEYKGTGVGLAICKKIVENHHGAIIAESTEGVGATFHVILPVL